MKANILKTVGLFSIALALSVLGHIFYIWLSATSGHAFIGRSDGMSQMMPLKAFIFEQYKEGNFLYSQTLAWGGGLFAQLNYYFTSNLFVTPWYIVIWLFGIDMNLEKWGMLLYPMSIVKQVAIFGAGFYFLKKFTKMTFPAFVGAVLYMMSPFFYKNQLITDNLTEILFFVPFLLIGVERIIRRQSPTFFIVALIICLVNNFYISFIVCMIVGIYVVLRWLIRIEDDELGRLRQLRTYALSVLLSFGISSIVFIPAAYSFLQNDRPPYSNEVEWFKFKDNLFINDAVNLWLCAAAFLAVLLYPLYKHKAYRLFAIIAVIGTIGYYSPMIGSFFNGLSAPNTRWTPIVTLSYAGLVSMMLVHLNQLKRWLWATASVITVIVIWSVCRYMEDYSNMFAHLAYIWIAVALVIFIIFKSPRIIGISIIAFVICFANLFLKEYSQDPMLADTYMSDLKKDEYGATKDVAQMVDYLDTHKMDDQVRVDYSERLLENIPSIQGVNGFSIYSSISNGLITHMYAEDLQINTGRESLSRYRALGDRRNLLALTHSQFYVRDEHRRNIPYGYEKVEQFGRFNVYENKDVLPTFRVVDTFYSSKSLEEAPVLAREHAMMNGAVVEDGEAPNPSVRELSYSKTMQYITLINEQIRPYTREHRGEIHLRLRDLSEDTKTLYVQFALQVDRLSSGEAIVRVNKDRYGRKPSYARYATGYNNLTFAVKADDEIVIRLPRGFYTMGDIHVYEENYDTLNTALDNAESNDMTWENGRASGTVEAKKGDLLLTPIPFEKGWSAKVNGKKVTLQKANYAFIGVPLEAGRNDVQLSYWPPYWKIAVPITVVSLIIFVLFIIWRKRKNNKNTSEMF